VGVRAVKIICNVELLIAWLLIAFVLGVVAGLHVAG
jgi:hypothetical protein